MVENIAKITFSYQRESEIIDSNEYSEKGKLTFTEKGIYMGLGSGRALKYPNFIPEEYYSKLFIDKLLSNKVNQDLVYDKSEIDSKLMNIKTNGFVDLDNYYNKQQVDIRLENCVGKNSITNHVKYLGSKDTIESLTSIPNPNIGDMYTVLSTKDNYVYSGDEWVKMMGIVDLSDYYTRSEINTELDKKANQDTTYAKNEVDSKLEEKLDKTELEEKLNKKLDASKILEYYNKTEINDSLDKKLDIDDSMPKTDLENALNLKADKKDTYTIEKIDKFIKSKADKDDTYTKTEVVDLLAEKANQDTTYTKKETDYQISTYQIPGLQIGDSYVKDKMYSYEKNKDRYFFISIEDGSNFDGNILDDSKFITFCPISKLKLKADRAEVYTKTEVVELIKKAIDEALKGNFDFKPPIKQESSYGTGNTHTDVSKEPAQHTPVVGGTEESSTTITPSTSSGSQTAAGSHLESSDSRDNSDDGAETSGDSEHASSSPTHTTGTEDSSNTSSQQTQSETTTTLPESEAKQEESAEQTDSQI